MTERKDLHLSVTSGTLRRRPPSALSTPKSNTVDRSGAAGREKKLGLAAGGRKQGKNGL